MVTPADKLDQARGALDDDSGLAVNVAPCRPCCPQISGWRTSRRRNPRRVPSEVLEDPTIRVEHPGGAIWDVKGNTHGVLATSQWGTARMAAPAIAKATLEQRPVQVTDDAGDGRRVLNAGETACRPGQGRRTPRALRRVGLGRA